MPTQNSWRVWRHGKHPQLTPEAKTDIADACRYIEFELENHQAAINLANGIYEVIYSLDVMPTRNPVWPREPWRFREVRWAAYKNYKIFMPLTMGRP